MWYDFDSVFQKNMVATFFVKQRASFSARPPTSEADVRRFLEDVSTRKSFHKTPTVGLDPPSEWDCRKQYPGKITPISHQSTRVGSACVASAAALADRWAIWNKVPPEALSPHYMTKHLGTNTSLLQAWLFLQNHGTVVERGDEGKQEEEETPEGFRARDVYHVVSGERNIRAEIYNHGPVTTTIPITHEFLQFWEEITGGTDEGTSKIFHFSAGGHVLGSHAVRMLGWGALDGQLYWILANSWGCVAGDTEYGSNGYFLVARGDESSRVLEEHVVAGLPFITTKDLQPECCESKEHHVANIHVSLLTSDTLQQLGLERIPPLPELKLSKRKLKHNHRRKKKKEVVEAVIKINHDSTKSASAKSTGATQSLASWWQKVDGEGFLVLCLSGIVGVVLAVCTLVVLSLLSRSKTKEKFVLRRKNKT